MAGNTWTLDLVGIFHVTDPKLRGQESSCSSTGIISTRRAQFGNGNVGWYITQRQRSRCQADRVAQAIDALSIDSDHETKTQTEQAFNAAFVSQFGDIGLIVGAIMGAVFFTLVLLTGNTMAQAVRERIPELAVLKTIGFSNRSVLSLVLAEAACCCSLAAVVGLVLAGCVVSAVRRKFGGQHAADAGGRRDLAAGSALMVLAVADRRCAAGAAWHAAAHCRCALGPLGGAREASSWWCWRCWRVIGLAVLVLTAPWWLLQPAGAARGLAGATRTGRQTWSVTEVGIATIPQRLGASSVVVVGIAGVVGVLVALLAMAEGFEATLKETGSDDTVIVMRGGAQTELNSVLDHDSADADRAEAAGAARREAAQPIASPELVVVASLSKKSTGLDANVEIRGVGERAWEAAPERRRSWPGAASRPACAS